MVLSPESSRLGRQQLARSVAEEWIRAHVEPVGPIETAHERPWATVLRVPLVDGVAWFKACAPVQAFEPRLTADLFARWSDRVAEVLGHDEERAWLLLADAGTPIGVFDNPPTAWLVALPLYAELQRGEVAHTEDHLAHGVPDLRVATLPARYNDLLRRDLPLERNEIDSLRQFAPRFSDLCAELKALDIPETVQHDDLHMANVYAQDERLRLLDWGDSSISHPFASLVVTFRFLEQRNKLSPDDPWFARLREAYLEPWGGRSLTDAFVLAIRVGAFAHTFAWARQRDHLPDAARPQFDEGSESCCDAPWFGRSDRAARQARRPGSGDIPERRPQTTPLAVGREARRKPPRGACPAAFLRLRAW